MIERTSGVPLFVEELTRAVLESGDAKLSEHKIPVLADADLLYVRGIAPAATYQFKHALIRVAAYEALLMSHRKDLHRLIAQTISQKFEALKAAQPEVLARHWTEEAKPNRRSSNGQGRAKLPKRAMRSSKRMKVLSGPWPIGFGRLVPELKSCQSRLLRDETILKLTNLMSSQCVCHQAA